MCAARNSPITMTKFVFLIVVALCLAQNFQRTLADLEEEEDHLIIKMLKHEMEKQLRDSSELLQDVYYNKQIKKDVEDNNITLKRIFKFAKQEIEELSEDTSTIAMECSQLAYNELDALQKKTKTDAAYCNVRGKKLFNEVIDDMMQHLREKTQTTLIDDYGRRIVAKCPETLAKDDILECVDMEEGMAIRKELEEETINVMDISKIIFEQIVKDVKSCLKTVKVNALKNTEHVTDELKSCIGET